MEKDWMITKYVCSVCEKVCEESVETDLYEQGMCQDCYWDLDKQAESVMKVHNQNC